MVVQGYILLSDTLKYTNTNDVMYISYETSRKVSGCFQSA
jgi:hypothetical protein